MDHPNRPWLASIHSLLGSPSTHGLYHRRKSRFAESRIPMNRTRFATLISLMVIAVVGLTAYGPVKAQAAPTLRYGVTSSQVTTLQQALDRNKQRDYFTYSGGYTSYFGNSTKSALTNWEKANSGTPAVSVNGTIVVNSAEWNLLMSQRKAESVIDSRCLTGTRVLCVSKKDNKVRYLRNGTLIYTLDARFGSDETPTRNGAYTVYWKSRNHVSTLYHTKMPYAMFFSGGQAVHYSPDFAARGYQGASHGCVNIRDRATIAKIFDEVKTGDKVIVS